MNSAASARITLQALAVALLGGIATTSAAETPQSKPTFRVEVDVVRQELHDDFCWFHPRVAAVPGMGHDGGPAVILAIQKHLRVSDYYSGMWTMRSDDLGQTWTEPTEVPELAWVREPDGVVVAVADVTPGWHAASQRLLAIGCSVRYSPQGRQLADVKRSSQTAYAVHDPRTGAWSRWQTLQLPDERKFDLARCGCCQWLVKPDGTLLIPIYFGESTGKPFSVTVLHCRFDAETITYLSHGTELSLNVVRGLCEPSLILCRGRYYMTLRNDKRAYVTTSEDGLHFEPIKPWTFDDGKELGSYNTQQHWLANGRALYLSYTRRGADNDHIFRHRAPLFVAQVDPQRLCVLRGTEQVVIAERGAAMGNFGAAAINGQQSWVTVSEYIDSNRRQPRGADGSTFAARVMWLRED